MRGNGGPGASNPIAKNCGKIAGKFGGRNQASRSLKEQYFCTGGTQGEKIPEACESCEIAKNCGRQTPPTPPADSALASPQSTTIHHHVSASVFNSALQYWGLLWRPQGLHTCSMVSLLPLLIVSIASGIQHRELAHNTLTLHLQRGRCEARQTSVSRCKSVHVCRWPPDSNNQLPKPRQISFNMTTRQLPSTGHIDGPKTASLQLRIIANHIFFMASVSKPTGNANKQAVLWDCSCKSTWRLMIGGFRLPGICFVKGITISVSSPGYHMAHRTPTKKITVLQQHSKYNPAR